MNNACPSEEVVADYLQGFLSDVKKTALERHFAACERCLDELATLETIGIEADADERDRVPEKVMEKVLDRVRNQDFNKIEKVVRKIRRTAQSLLLTTSDYVNALFGVPSRLQSIRGAKKNISRDLIQLTLAFEEVKADIEIEKVKEQRVNIRVNVFKGIQQDRSIRVSLGKDERDLFSFILDKKGYAVFENIAYGRYIMTFRQNGEIVGMYPFEIKETLHDK